MKNICIKSKWDTFVFLFVSLSSLISYFALQISTYSTLSWKLGSSSPFIMEYSFQIPKFKLTEQTNEAYVCRFAKNKRWWKRKREIPSLILWVIFVALNFNLETLPRFPFHELYGQLPPDRHTSFYKYPFKFDTRAICYAVLLWFSGRILPNLHLIMWSIWLCWSLTTLPESPGIHFVSQIRGSLDVN